MSGYEGSRKLVSHRTPGRRPALPFADFADNKRLDVSPQQETPSSNNPNLVIAAKAHLLIISPEQTTLGCKWRNKDPQAESELRIISTDIRSSTSDPIWLLNRRLFACANFEAPDMTYVDDIEFDGKRRTLYVVRAPRQFSPRPNQQLIESVWVELPQLLLEGNLTTKAVLEACGIEKILDVAKNAPYITESLPTDVINPSAPAV